MSKYFQKGFTLIELLVVISIISLLSSVVLSSLNSARAGARDAQRLSDIQQLGNALEMYFHDNNGSYPITGWVHSDELEWETVLGAALQPYLPSMPTDPINDRSFAGVSNHGAVQYVYSYSTSANFGPEDKWYVMTFRMENSSSSLRDTDGAPSCKLSRPRHSRRGASRDGMFHYGHHDRATLKDLITVGPGCAVTPQP